MIYLHEDPAERKVLLGAIRYLAHVNGHSVYCTSRKHSALNTISKIHELYVLQAPTNINAAKRNQTDVSKPLSLMHRMTF